jgi:hypothetical protein
MAKVEWHPRKIDDKIQVTVRTNEHTNGVLMFTPEDYDFFMAIMRLRSGPTTGGHEIVVETLTECGPPGLGQVP